MGINVSVDPPKNGDSLKIQQNIFVRLEGESVVGKSLDADVVRALQDGVVALKHDDYHVTTKFHAEDLAAIREVTSSKELARTTREAIHKKIDSALEEKVPIDTSRHFLAALRRLGKKPETIRAELPEIPPAPEPLEVP